MPSRHPLSTEAAESLELLVSFGFPGSLSPHSTEDDSPATTNISEPRDLSSKTRAGLEKLRVDGCNVECILACSLLLAEPDQSWNWPIPRIADRTKILSKAASLVKKLCDTPEFRPEAFFDEVRGHLIRDVPDMLGAYREKVDSRAKLLEKLYSKRLIRGHILKLLREYISSKTGQPHWAIIADLVNEYGRETSEDALKIACKRANKLNITS